MHSLSVTPESIFLGFAAAKLETLSVRILAAQAQLSDEQFGWSSNEASNSVANLLLHLEGNLRQWILAGFLGQPDHRDRDAEFAPGVLDRPEILGRFQSTVAEVLSALGTIAPSQLTEVIHPQGYRVTVLEAVFHVTEHFSYHAGQIFLLVKMFTNQDLGFYAHLANSNRAHTETLP